MFLGEEPYHSIQLYINLESKKFLVRILGFTRRTGEYGNIGELVDLCRETFGNVVACVGVLEPKVSFKSLSLKYRECLTQINSTCLTQGVTVLRERGVGDGGLPLPEADIALLRAVLQDIREEIQQN